MTIQNDDTPDARTSMDHTRLESHPASAVPSLQDNEELRPPRVRSTPRTESERIAYDLFEQIALERSEVAFSEFYDRLHPKCIPYYYEWCIRKRMHLTCCRKFLFYCGIKHRRF